jgi:hypothetical protein
MTPNEAANFPAFLDAVSDAYDADVFLYSGSINTQGFGQVVSEISKKAKANALLILTTNGGLANPAYQIARLFQRSYKQFVVYTPSTCASAGTLLAIGAHKLIMDQFSELGPIDVQLLQKNEIGARKSGLLSRSAFESLSEAGFELFQAFMLKILLASGGSTSFRVASDIAASMASQMMTPIYGQINPDTVGSDFRDLNVAREYGLRLAENSKNADMDTIYKLVDGYPSHDFIIDDHEAKSLFVNVEKPSQDLYRLVGLFADEIFQEATPSVIKKLEKPQPNGTQEATGSTNEHSKEKSTAQGTTPDSADGERVDDSRTKNRKRNRGLKGSPEAES